MQCRQALRAMAAQLAGTLNETEAAVLAEHLRHCGVCGHRARQQQLSSTADIELAPGSRIDRYVVLSTIGGGAVGVVCAAYDSILDRRVALKLLRQRDDVVVREKLQEQLLHEAQSMARVAHPNVVVVYDIGLFEGRIFISMELVDGCDLWRWLRDSPRSWQQVLPILIEAGEGLRAAHAAGLVHRDIKPSNVLIGVDGRVRVSDFGLVHLVETVRAGSGAGRGSSFAHSSSGDIAERLLDCADGNLRPMGTPLYMSPEQLLGDPVSEASDQFSFCVALYESFYGLRPYSGTTVPELRAGLARGRLRSKPPDRSVPAWLHRVLLTGLQVQPERRHASMTALLAALRKKARERPHLGANPYQGLAPFTEITTDRFFGRERLTNELWDAFSAMHRVDDIGAPTPRLLPIVGPSGCGKSSLARAGLLPELVRRPIPGMPPHRVAYLRPGADPLRALAQSLERIDEPMGALAGESAEAPGEPEGVDANRREELLACPAGSAPAANGGPLLLFVDQFEELFTQCTDAAIAATFVDKLLRAAAHPSGRVSVLIALRSDFLGQLQSYPDLSKAVATRGMLVPPLEAEELRRAIAEPAARAGRPLDKAVIDLLVAETAGREGALPLLQFALMRVWQGMARDVEPADTLRQVGGVGGALACEAERLYCSLDPRQQAIARRVFLCMVRFGDGGPDARRRVSLHQLVVQDEQPEAVREVLRLFAADTVRLVSLSAGDDGSESAEVTHEALLAHWARLRGWLQTNRSDLLFHRRFALAVRHWHEQGRPDGLLWRPPDLDRLRKFSERRAADMTRDEVAFLRTSARRYRRATTLRRAAVIGLALLTVTASVATVAAREWGLQAAQEARVARSRELAAYAQDTLQTDPSLSFRLAEAALQSEPTPLARRALWSAYDRPLATVLDGHDDAVVAAAYSPDGTRVVTASRDRTARIWQGQSGETLHVLRGHTGPLLSAQFSADGILIVTTAADGTARLWKAANGEAVHVLSGHTIDREVSDAKFSPDGAHLVTAARSDNKALLWNTSTGELVEGLDGDPSGTHTAVFSANGRFIATASVEAQARLWRAQSGELLAVLRGDSQCRSVDFSPDASHVVTAWASGEAWIWDTARATVTTILHVSSAPLISASYSPSGQHMLTASEDGVARTWRAASGKLIREFSVRPGELMGAAYSPAGARIVTAASDGTARVWDAHNGALLHLLRGHGAAVTAALFAPHGAGLLTTSNDGTARLWSPPSSESHFLTGHTKDVAAVAYSSDGRRVATGSDDYTARVWESDGWRVLHVLAGHRDAVRAVAFSPDSRRLATASQDKTARLWDVIRGELLCVLPGHRGVVDAVAFSPSDDHIATGSWDGTVRLWDGARCEALRIWDSQDSEVHAVAFSPAGDMLVTGGLDGSAKVWRAESGEPVLVLEGHEGTVQSVAFAPDGRSIATASSDDTVRIWDIQAGEPVRTIRPVWGQVNQLRYSPDGVHLAVAGRDRKARLLGVASGQVVQTFSGHRSSVLAVAFSPNGRFLVTGSSDHTARRWSVGRNEESTTFGGHAHAIETVRLSLDGQRVMTRASAGDVRIWDSNGWQPLVVLPSQRVYTYATAFSLDGRLVITASSDQRARLWDAHSGKLLVTLEGDELGFSDVAIAPDGARVATASADKSARLWDPQRGELVASLTEHAAMVNTVAFSPDGDHLVTGASDGAARVWNVADATLVLKLGGEQPQGLRARYLLDGRLIVTSSDRNETRVWDARTGEPLHRFSGFLVAVSSDGRRVATAEPNSDLTVWDSLSGASVFEVASHGMGHVLAALAPDGNEMVTVLPGRAARLWDLRQGELKHEYSLAGYPTDNMVRLIYMPNGQRILSVTHSGEVRLWPATYQQIVRDAAEFRGLVRRFSEEEQRRYCVGPDPWSASALGACAVSSTRR